MEWFDEMREQIVAVLEFAARGVDAPLVSPHACDADSWKRLRGALKALFADRRRSLSSRGADELRSAEYRKKIRPAIRIPFLKPSDPLRLC
jgi:hypothetical protein